MVHQAAQNLVAVSIAGLEEILNNPLIIPENAQVSARDICFAVLNSFAGADVVPGQDDTDDYFKEYQRLAPTEMQKAVAEAFEDIYTLRREKESPAAVIESLIKSLPGGKIKISGLVKSAKILLHAEMKSRKIKKMLEQALLFADEKSGEASFCLESSPEAIAKLIDAKPIRIGIFEKIRLIYPEIFGTPLFGKSKEWDELENYLNTHWREHITVKRKDAGELLSDKLKRIEKGACWEDIYGILYQGIAPGNLYRSDTSDVSFYVRNSEENMKAASAVTDGLAGLEREVRRKYGWMRAAYEKYFLAPNFFARWPEKRALQNRNRIFRQFKEVSESIIKAKERVSGNGQQIVNNIVVGSLVLDACNPKNEYEKRMMSNIGEIVRGFESLEPIAVEKAAKITILCQKALGLYNEASDYMINSAGGKNNQGNIQE